jgi:hypothetical protein
VLLEGVALTGTGREGGYDYGVYLNLPAMHTPAAEERTFAVDQFGTFNISMAQIKGMKGMPMTAASSRGTALTFPLADVLQRQRQAGLAPGQALSLSFVPFGAPKGVSANAALVSVSNIRIAS